MNPKPKLVPPVSPAEAPKPTGGPAYRIRSVRGYRRMLDWATRRMLQGLMSKEDLLAVTSAAKAGAELMMSENILPRGFVKRKIVVKSGINKDGESFDETAVTKEGDIKDDELPTEVEGIPV